MCVLREVKSDTPRKLFKWVPVGPPPRGLFTVHEGDTHTHPKKVESLLSDFSVAYLFWRSGVFRWCHWSQTYPPAQNQYMQEKNLGELIFARMHAGPVFALAWIQENILYFREGISRVFCQILRGIHSVRIHAAPVFAPARIQENIPGELLMYLVSCQGVVRATLWNSLYKLSPFPLQTFWKEKGAPTLALSRSPSEGG